MDKKTVAKAGAGAGGIGAVLISLVLILSNLGATTDVSGRYTINKATSQSVEFVAEDVKEVPEATFYDLVLSNNGGDYVLGKANYGSGKGVMTAPLALKPIENISVVVYDQNLEEIGVGTCKENGVIEYKFKEGLVTKDDKEANTDGTPKE